MIISELFDSFMTKQKIHGKVKLTENTQFGFEYYDTMSSSHSANRPLIMSYEELITCPICLEYFTKPRYLPCLHTYCEDCLSDYISTAYKQDEEGFSCPTCRLFNRIPINEDKSPKLAAAGFPVNHLIMTLLDQKNIEQKEVVCQSCFKRGQDAPGKFWCYSCSAALCEICGDFHRSLPILADHRIAPIDDSEDTPSVVSSTHDVCEVHPGKKLEMFCQDHDVACCVTCTMVNHRKCETVLTLQDAAKGSKDTKESDKIASTIKVLIEDIDSKINMFTKDYETLEKASECRRKEIQEFSDKVIKHVETLNTEFDRKLITERATQMNEIQERKRDLLNMQNMLANCERVLQAAENKCSKVQLLTLIPKISKLRDESRSKLEDMKKKPTKLHTEIIIDETIKACTNIASLGELKQI